MSEEEERILEEESTGYLMSVSDMMSGLLFIFIITLTAFIISFQTARDKFQSAQEQAQAAVHDLTDSQIMKEKMLIEIQQSLKKKYGVNVKIDTQNGILRLTEDTLTFPSGKAKLPTNELNRLKNIASALTDVIPCYAANAPAKCDSRKKGELEAAFIEGHTDNVKIDPGSKYEDNLELSTARAAYTYKKLLKFKENLGQLKNKKGQPIFSVSGYGSKRPVHKHKDSTADAANRRIDLRFIMASPSIKDNPVVEDIKKNGLK